MILKSKIKNLPTKKSGSRQNVGKKSKIILLFILFGLCILNLNCFAAPVISLSKSSFELGNIKEGTIVERSLVIENKGDEELFVEAKVSCGCVRILGKKRFRILPGEKEKIHFSFNSTGYQQKVTNYIYINSNDPQNKSLKIPVSAFIVRIPAEVIERFLSFNLIFYISAGLTDGINPCAFTVLVFFISFLTFAGYTKKKMFIVGFSFIFAVFITYILIGLGLFEFIRRLEVFSTLAQWIKILVALFAIILGVISLYDFFIYRKTKDFERIRLRLPLFFKKKIQEIIREKTDIRGDKFLAKDFRLLLSAFIAGFSISFLEFICTGQIYLPTIVYILKTTPYKLQAAGYLLLYNLMFIFPLIFILYLGIRGVTTEGFANFARKNLAKVKLATAFIFFILGISILVIAQPVSYSKYSKVDLIIIKPKDCLTCNTELFVKNLKNLLADLEIREVYYRDKEAELFLSDLRIDMLPAYLLNKEIKERKEYQRLKDFLIDTKKDYFYFDPSFAGASYFLGRKKISGRLDLFISTQIPGLDKILEVVRDLIREEKIDFYLHFLAQEREIEGFISPAGISEIEEYLRCVCIKKYYQEKFFDYLICRAKNKMSSWWENCAEGFDIEKIKMCATGEEGKGLLRENVRLTKELSIFQAPLVLLFNQEIFGITKDTSVEELKSFLKRNQ